MTALSFGHFLKDFFLLLELGTKAIFFIIKGMMSQMVEGLWFCYGRFQVVRVSVG